MKALLVITALLVSGCNSSFSIKGVGIKACLDNCSAHNGIYKIKFLNDSVIEGLATCVCADGAVSDVTLGAQDK